MNGFEKRAEEKKQKILKATFELMNSKEGIAKVRIEDIVNTAQVGKTTIFKYFGSKENIFHEVFTGFLKRIDVATHEIMKENISFENTLQAISQMKVQYLREVSPQFYLDLMQYFTEKNDDGRTLLMQKYMKESTGIMLDILHRGKKEGKVDLKYSDEFLLLYFQALVEGVSSHHIYEKILPYTSEWVEVMIRGIAPGKE